MHALLCGHAALDAGGKGELCWELRALGVPATLLEPRAMKLTKRQRAQQRCRSGGRGEGALVRMLFMIMIRSYSHSFVRA